VPRSLPAGRNGFQPHLDLVYSTGYGNGSFGLGWTLSVPGIISEPIRKGVPHYDDQRDLFVLSGRGPGLPPVKSASATPYRPRTEGLFARIHRHHDRENDYWQVETKDGLRSEYGTPRSAWQRSGRGRRSSPAGERVRVEAGSDRGPLRQPDRLRVQARHGPRWASRLGPAVSQAGSIHRLRNSGRDDLVGLGHVRVLGPTPRSFLLAIVDVTVSLAMAREDRTRMMCFCTS
jgi:Salmonella virulence plasmid 65kDa B protein